MADDNKNLSMKEHREKCWNARDEYFNCLLKENEDQSKCKLIVMLKLEISLKKKKV